MTGEEKWDLMTKAGDGKTQWVSLLGIVDRPLTSRELDGIRWAAMEIVKLRGIIKEINESGVCK